MVSTVAAILVFNKVGSRVVAQTLCPSRNPKRSSHKGLIRETVQATDKICSPHENPARSIDAEKRRWTSDERLDENAGEHHPAV